jgi:hypothetical protein
MPSVGSIFFGSFVALAGWGTAAQTTDRAVRSEIVGISSSGCLMTVPPDAVLYPVTGQVLDHRTGQPIPGASVSLSSRCHLPPACGAFGRRRVLTANFRPADCEQAQQTDRHNLRYVLRR